MTWTCPAAGLWHIAATFSFNMNTNDQPCSFQLYHNGSEMWYFTAWYNIAVAGEGIMTQCESIFLNLATGNTLEWYLGLGGSITMTIGRGNNNSVNTPFTSSESLLDTPLHNQGCCNKYIVCVPLSETTIIMRKVEHLK